MNNQSQTGPRNPSETPFMDGAGFDLHKSDLPPALEAKALNAAYDAYNQPQADANPNLDAFGRVALSQPENQPVFVPQEVAESYEQKLVNAAISTQNIIALREHVRKNGSQVIDLIDSRPNQRPVNLDSQKSVNSTYSYNPANYPVSNIGQQPARPVNSANIASVDNQSNYGKAA